MENNKNAANRYSSGEAARTVSENKFIDQAYIQNSSLNAPSAVRVITVDLSTARDDGNMMAIGFPFKCVFISSATDSQTNIQLKPFSDSMQNDFVPLTKNSVLTFDKSINKCYLKNTAQSGASITLVFMTDANFNTGNTLTEVASSVDGNSIIPITTIVASSTPVQLVPQDLTRKILNIYSDAVFEISNAAQLIWFPMPAGYSKIKNTAQIYVRATAGANIQMMGEY